MGRDNSAIRKMLWQDEGEVLHAYQDSLGYWTIGIGRMVDKRKGGGITHVEAMILLENDINRTIAELNLKLPWWSTLSPERQDVIINMAFNLGVDGLLKFKNTLELIAQGLYQQAGDSMLQSKWASQVGDRAKRLSKIMKGGAL